MKMVVEKSDVEVHEHNYGPFKGYTLLFLRVILILVFRFLVMRGFLASKINVYSNKELILA